MDPKMIFAAAAASALLLMICGCDADRADDGRPKVFIMADGTDENAQIVVNVELAETPEEIGYGLMNRESLGEDSGMLFVFDDEDYRSFWMKNMIIPLDMIFISADGAIVDIKESFGPCVTGSCASYRSKEKAMYVLEVNAGFAGKNNINEGDTVVIR